MKHKYFFGYSGAISQEKWDRAFGRAQDDEVVLFSTEEIPVDHRNIGVDFLDLLESSIEKTENKCKSRMLGNISALARNTRRDTARCNETRFEKLTRDFIRREMEQGRRADLLPCGHSVGWLVIGNGEPHYCSKC